MSETLNASQIAWENGWLDRVTAASDSLDTAKWVRPFFATDASWKFGNNSVVEGATSIETTLEQTCSILGKMRHFNFRRSFDVANNLAYQKADIGYTLKADKEALEIVITGIVVYKKRLGVQEEKLESGEVYLDLTPVLERLAKVTSA